MDAPLPVSLVSDWEKLFERGVDILECCPCPDVFDHPILYPLQRRRELRRMLDMSRDAEVLMEIGADKGGGVFHFLFALPLARKVIANEIRGVPYADTFRAYAGEREFHGIAASSYAPETVAEVASILGPDKLDVLFLDGDKCGYDKDFHAYLPLMRPGGIVFMHDVQDRIPPREVFEALQSEYRTETILDTTEAVEALARKNADQPARTGHEVWLYIWGESSCGVGVVHV